MSVATKTLQAINKSIEQAAPSGNRWHLGASLIGRSCTRYLWYKFRWALDEEFEARMHRLFERGQLEEQRFVGFLRAIGVEVYDRTEDGNQYRISDCDGHFGGSLDGIGVGIPDLPTGVPALLEFKTHNDNSFKKLKTDGLLSTKFVHFVQMQTYMFKMNLPFGLYCAVNKNDDDIYMELVSLDIGQGQKYVERAKGIIFGTTPPARINESPGWWECKSCAFRDICHLTGIPDINCRTCAYGTPGPNGRWYCHRGHDEHINDTARHSDGCEEHVFNPQLLGGIKPDILQYNFEENWIEVRFPDGVVAKLGPRFIDSKQLKAQGYTPF